MRTNRFGFRPEQIEVLVRDAHRQRAEYVAGLFNRAFAAIGRGVEGVREIAQKCTAARLGHS